MLGAVTATAAALTIGTVGPPAPAAEAAAGVFTTGPIFRALDAVGVDITDFLPPEVQAILDTLGVSIENVPANSVDIYNAINGVSFGLTRSRSGAVVGLGLGSSATSHAYQALIASSQGDTPEGYDPLVPGSRLLPNRTNLVFFLIRNPGRPNGGLCARFAPLAALFGVDTVTPPGGRVPDSVDGIDLNAGMIDVTWAYDVLSDAPVTLNPVSWANSIAASIFLTNLLGGVQVAGDDPETALLNAGLILTGGLVGVTPTGQTSYITLVPNDLALLEPMRLPVRVINAVTGWNLGTPLADAIQPAVQILVDIGYPDVVREPDGTYHRTYDTAGTPTPLLSEFPLDSPAAYLQVPFDVVRALVRGFQDVFFPPRSTTPTTPQTPLSIEAVSDSLTALADTQDEAQAWAQDAAQLVAQSAADPDPSTPSAISVVPKPEQVNLRDASKAATTPDNELTEAVDASITKSRSDLRKATTLLRSQIRDAGKDTRQQVRSAIRDTGDKVEKPTDDVSSAVKKAVSKPSSDNSAAADKKSDKTEKAGANN